jgi:glyoxylase-like metal-dependent hydrolase (beta-lactamase superfamily II)
MVLLALLVAAAPARGQGDVFTLRPIGPGVVVAEVLRNPSAYAFANSLIVIGDDGVLVVDTQQSLTAARALIAEIARITPLPVRWVVNTHWHGDHVNGNQAYAAAFPDVEFIAHESVVEDMATLGVAARERELAELPASIAAREEWLASGIGPDGASLTDASRATVVRSLQLRRAYLGELRTLTPVPPTRTFREGLELRVGFLDVVLLHAGPAHTRGDILVQLPGLGIVAVGDLLEHGMPWFGDAAPRGWYAALRLIASLDPLRIVPSHGPPQTGRALLDDQLALLDAVLHAPAPATDEAFDSAPWPELEQRFLERYGVSAAAFRAGVAEAWGRITQP